MRDRIFTALEARCYCKENNQKNNMASRRSHNGKVWKILTKLSIVLEYRGTGAAAGRDAPAGHLYCHRSHYPLRLWPHDHAADVQRGAETKRKDAPMGRLLRRPKRPMSFSIYRDTTDPTLTAEF